MLIRMLHTHITWPDINTPREYIEGEEYVVKDSVGDAFINLGLAVDAKAEELKWKSQ